MTHDYHEQTTPYQAFLFERLHRATTSRLVRTMFVLTIILLFLLLMYDLLTGTLSFRIMKMLIISTLLLIQAYVIPIVITFVILVVATTHYIRMRIRAKRYHHGNDILL